MNSLASFHNIHQNETIVVCGCGESLNDFAEPERFITIGVNDVGRKFQPDYLVVVNPRKQFSGDRFRFVESSRAKYLFTQLDLGLRHPNVVKFKLGQSGGTDFSNSNVLHYTDNSPYIALCLAIQMGAKRIGLIGVDFTDNHFFAQTGRHPLAPRFEKINEQYSRLATAAKAFGIEIFNLSEISRLTAFPKIPLNEFGSSAAAPKKSASLKIVSYATTPVAGVPAILARCIAARTNHSARCVWATNSYGNGVSFAGDVQWQETPELAESLLAEADLIIAHNGKVAPAHRKLFKNKAVVTMAHNYLWNVDAQFVRKGFAGVVVGQYQAALPEFKDWSIVPNPMPFWENEYQAENKPEQIAICYTPYGKYERYAPGHKLFWHAKGYETTMRVLEKLSKRFPLKLEVIAGGQISHAESMAMKRRSHIVIDECVTGSYHRNSLEGLATGCVVVNGLGILPEVVDVLRFCTGNAAEIPFVSATLENLEEVLTQLIESGKVELIQKGLKNRAWLEENWDFAAQWEKFWMPALEKSLQKTNRKIFSGKSETIASGNIAANEMNESLEMKELKKGVSVVIPHGGENRLPHLRACLANLRQCRDVAEIIIVEMDEGPTASEIARKWADKYVFLHRADLFERARALNVGSVFAESEFVLWLDNDLLIPPDFISRAVTELRARELDFLTPFSAIRYLSQADSGKVMQGISRPVECRPLKVYYSHMTDGGTGLVRKDFLRRIGGIPAGFRGWGGEDNGWMHKVSLLGKGGRTKLENQIVFHLYHDLSGAYGGNAHLKANPHYRENLSLLEKINAVSDPQQFMENFPPPPVNLWENTKQICFVGGKKSASGAASEVSNLFGAQIELISPAKLKKSAKHAPDAIVFFDCRAAFDFLSDDAFAHFAEKTLVVADKKCALTTDEEAKLRQCAGVLAIDETIAGKLAERNIKHRMWKSENGKDSDFQSLALALAQPLSLIINARAVSAESEKPAQKSAASDLPVWFYWEGKCPEWIEACRRTILAKAPNARFLTPETFGELWTEDRDIRLSRLYVAHRADFIRAYLLAKFGGLWLDADCIVMQSLQPLLDKLGEYDFIAHRERNGFFTNGLMAAKSGSVIARQFYEKICQVLRKRRAISWREIGGEPLTEVLRDTGERFLELACERIQPICWSEPGKYFVTGSEPEHRQKLDEQAFCYMLSNGAVIKYKEKNPHARLTAENTFFSFLVRHALNAKTTNGHISSQNGASQIKAKSNGKTAHVETPAIENRFQPVSFYLEMFARLAPQKVLDIDVGLGRWAVLLRDLFESSTDKKHWQMSIEAIVAAKPKSSVFPKPFYNRVRVGALDECLKSLDEKPDLLILGDYLTRNSALPSEKLLEQALEFSDYILLNISRNKNNNGSNNAPDLLRYFERHPERVTAYRGNGDGASFLISQTDPKNLRPPSRSTEIFQDMAQLFAAHRLESVSGPGSSLAQTAEIRRRLPLLFARLEINSMLDAPCGDHNWLHRVDLKLEKYVGIDIVPQIVEQNRSRFENQIKRFHVTDITRDFLPQCDLILCRDCLVHLSFAEISTALRNFGNSGAKYLLTTTFPKRQTNTDIQTGGWRTLNFQLPPFNFPPPMQLLNERCTEGNGRFNDKSLGLWSFSDIHALIEKK
jgi:hypothetical protein